MSDKDTSTLQSYVDKAGAAVQSAIGSLTGNVADQVRALRPAYYTPHSFLEQF